MPVFTLDTQITFAFSYWSTDLANKPVVGNRLYNKKDEKKKYILRMFTVNNGVIRYAVITCNN